ncbi:MAG: hypothetical protein JO333_01025 [Verrucomicrobia bacterium]|nr:hypothetical protein [Verrucomicrobiota bacterium]
MLASPFPLFQAAFILSLCATVPQPSQALADPASNESAAEQTSTRYGLFGLLDSRSGYGQGVFPEPFIVDDSDLETNEARLDWLHSKIGSQHSDVATGEIEKAFGVLTLEIEIPYQWDVANGQRQEGFDKIDLGARVPVFQYVSSNGFLDSTFGVAFEAGIPTGSTLSKNAEFVPKVFNDLRLGEHFTVQSILGYSTLTGPGPDGGLQTFEYGFVFGYTIQHEELPIPHVLQLIPVFELLGETGLDSGQNGATSIKGNLAIRANLKTIGSIQPRLGIGYVFPIDRGARQDLHWGIITSLVFEY